LSVLVHPIAHLAAIEASTGEYVPFLNEDPLDEKPTKTAEVLREPGDQRLVLRRHQSDGTSRE
jgi:hypothetical protein